MKKLIFILLVMLSLALEAKVRVAGISPNLTVLLAYYMGLRHGHTRGLLTGAGLGLLTDILSGDIIGPNVVSKCAAGYLPPYLRGGLFTWTPILGMIGIFSLTALDGLISYTLVSIFSHPPTTVLHAAGIVFWQAAANLAAGAILRPLDEY